MDIVMFQMPANNGRQEKYQDMGYSRKKWVRLRDTEKRIFVCSEAKMAKIIFIFNV